MTQPADDRPASRNRLTAALIAGAISLLLIGYVAADYWSALPPEATATYVGRSSCIDCHQEQAALFRDSHHDQAMALATEASVIGDFDDAELQHYGITSRMFREGDRYMIHTEGPDGKMQDFHVKYVFGVDPLQQYMVEFDRTKDMSEDEVGRLQVLRVSWDTHNQKWFYLDPPDVREKLRPDDDLHWTGIAQRWNTMCAECHSTNLVKGFDDKAAQYHTTWSEIDVSCEACHGPGSMHVELANSRSLFWDRNHGYGLAKLKGENSIPQIEACAPCHSRRRVVHPGFEPGKNFCDYYEPELLHQATYHANGEIKDEVYVYGSFIQSKMFHKGIRCSDCHDPHSLKLKMPGNETCTSCHAHPAGKYDTPSHHHHEPGTKGASCVECHMPETTYMAVDPRRDHSIRIPRPDLSVNLETPNSCTGCHLEIEKDKPVEKISPQFAKLADFLKTEPNLGASEIASLSEYAGWLTRSSAGNREIKAALAEMDEWCDDACTQWYGSERKQPLHFASALDAARRGQPDALQKLANIVQSRNEVMPDLAKATALEELRMRSGSKTVTQLADQIINHENPVMRAAAVRAFEGRSPETIRMKVVPALSDPSRLVRSEAARVLTAVPRDRFAPGPRDRFDVALEEFKAGLMVNNDRASAHLSWGVLLEQQGRFQEAVAAYETAIRVQPGAVGPRSNLAQLLESLIQMRRVAPSAGERIAELRAEELPLLRRDADLAPDNAPLQHRLGLLMYLNDQIDEALKRLERSYELEPENTGFLTAYVLLLQKTGDLKRAETYCKRLVRMTPGNSGNVNLLRDIQRAAASGN